MKPTYPLGREVKQMESEKTEKKQRVLFKPGQSGNPAGRPKGARNKLSEDFLEDLAKDWKENGAAAIKDMRAVDPSGYVKVVAGLLPKQVEINETLDVIGDAELIDVVAALRAAIATEQARSGNREKGSRKQATDVPAIH